MRLQRTLRQLVVMTGIGGALGIALSPALAGKSKFNNVLAVGDPAPEWKDLPGIDEKRHSLGDYKHAQALVVVFTCNRCPVAKSYEQRLLAFAKKYAERKVQIIAINANRGDGERLDRMKSRAAAAGSAWPYLRDESQKTARAYGATATPHFFLLDSNRKIAYMGAFDDNLAIGEVEKNFLADAVDAVLAGKTPPVKESLQRGCAIDYE